MKDNPKVFHLRDQGGGGGGGWPAQSVENPTRDVRVVFQLHVRCGAYLKK